MTKAAVDYMARWHFGATTEKDVVITLALRVYSPLNGSHGRWQGHAFRNKKQRHAAAWGCSGPLSGYRASLKDRHVAGVVVTLTRIAPRSLDDDNAIAGFKHIRDGVAEALGVDDGDRRLTWNYSQERGKPNEYAVKVTVMGRAE